MEWRQWRTGMVSGYRTPHSPRTRMPEVPFTPCRASGGYGVRGYGGRVCEHANIEARDPERAVLPPRVEESEQKADNGDRAGRPASPIGRGTINGAAAAPRSRLRSPLSSATLRLPLRPQEQTPASMTAEPRDVLAEVRGPRPKMTSTTSIYSKR